MYKLRFLLVILVLTVVSCAKRGSITGGLKDTIAPIMRSSSPENYTTNFNVKEVRITFDEYIKIKDVNKQLIVSPPMEYAPVITPSNASKYINIRIRDTLKDNTTYSFNFGNSIQDNNEGNVYQQFKYVFSTGSYIDSLEISGTIRDAIKNEVDNFVSVMLYEVDEKFTDSIVYKQNPRYITNTLDSLKTFKLENLKEGKYMLIALKDYNNNFKFNANKDKIAFRKQFITVPTDSVFELKLFNEIASFKGIRPYQASGNRLVVPHEGNAENLKITLRNGTEDIPFKVTKFPEKDSLQLWFKPFKPDSLTVSMKKDKFDKEFTIKIKEFKKDTLSFTPKQSGTLHPREKFTITSSLPIDNIDQSKIKLINKDSVDIAYTTKYDEFNQEIMFDFKQEEMQTYNFKILPGALNTYLDTANDTLNYTLKTQTAGDYGNLKVNLRNANRFPLIVELTNPKGELIASEYSEGETVIYFNGLRPGTFLLRAIYDDNKNKIWDTGSYLEKRQPEEVIYYRDTPNKDLLDVRTNWEVEQDFNLSP